MNSSIVTVGLRRFGGSVIKNAPTIMTALAVVGVPTTAIAAAKGHVKANDILNLEAERRMYRWEKDTGESPEAYPIDPMFTFKERTTLTWKCYIPAVASGVITVTLIIAANRWHLRKEAALLGLYSITEKAYTEYKKKVLDTIGKAKEEDIRGAIAQDALDKKPVSKETVILTGDGEHLVYDKLSGRYFRSNIEKIRKIENDLNFQALTDSYFLLNDLYYELGLENITLGERNGWATEYALMHIDFSSKIADSGEPCLVMDFQIAPGKIG